ncbi:hypothetical protein N431DRAFT_427052 [Stipitochalara longipes BDJ]|nr:hypothetical protein N431DRAFT_427052 [Stipitochalara longipes BDJ]
MRSKFTERSNRSTPEFTMTAPGQQHSTIVISAKAAAKGKVLQHLSTKSEVNTQDDRELFLEHLATITIELATFVHGAVACAVSLTLPTPPKDIAHNSNLGMWKDKCTTCGTPLPRFSWSYPSRTKGISVEIYNVRVGNHRIRSTISQNRPYIYSCFATIFPERIYSNPSFAPFFFYFASLVHTEYRIVRGRKTMLG